MHQIRKRLTYANVMSSIAVFLVLGGAAYAASQLPKNSVGTKQLKKNAVTTAKIKKSAVNGSKVADGSLTGADINLGSLGTVPSATNASHASAADTVGGNSVRKISYFGAPTSAEQTILSLDGLTLKAVCTGDELSANATTSVANSEIHSGGTFLEPKPFYAENDSFSPGEKFEFLDETETENDSIEGTLTYAQPNSSVVVTAVFLAEEDPFGSGGCAIDGFATG